MQDIYNPWSRPIAPLSHHDNQKVPLQFPNACWVPLVEDFWTRQGRLLCVTQKEFGCFHEAMRTAEGFISRGGTQSGFLAGVRKKDWRGTRLDTRKTFKQQQQTVQGTGEREDHCSLLGHARDTYGIFK